MTSRIKLVRADTFKFLPTLADKSIDTIVTSPPYWAIKEYNTDGDTFGNEPTLEEHLARVDQLLEELHRVLSLTGSAWVNIGFKRCNRTHELINLPALWAERAAMAGFTLKQMIVWNKTHCVPNSPTNRERDTYEQILHLTKLGSGYHYDMSASRKPYKNAQLADPKSQHRKVRRWFALSELTYAQAQKAHAEIDRRTAAGECNRIRGPKERPIHSNSASGSADSRARAIARDGYCFDDFHPQGAVGGNVWAINGDDTRGLDHPCPFPVQLAHECIRRTCPPTGVVFDPFMGVGSSALAAKRLGVRFVGVEILKQHCETAKRRLKNV